MTTDKPLKLATRVFYNTAIQIGGKIISILIGLLSVALITRYLGLAGFGSYATIIAFVSFFAALADFGMTLVTSQMISRPQADEPRILNGLFGLRLVSIVGILALAPIIGSFFPYNPAIKIGILISTLSYIFPALNQIIIGLLQKHLRLDRAAIAEVFGRFLLITGIFWVIKTDAGLNGLLWIHVLSAAGSFLLAYFLASSIHWLKPHFDFAFWRQVLLRSWPLALTTLLNLIYLKSDTIALSLSRPSAEVGLYAAADRAVEVLSTLPFLFAGIILPILTRSWAENKNDYFKKVLQKSLDLMSIIAIPLIVGTFILGDSVMVLLAGEEFIASGLILKILILAVAGVFIGCIFSHAILAIDKQKKIISAYAFIALSSLILYVLLIPRWSYLAAALITVYSEWALAYLAIRLVKKHTDFQINFRALKKSLLAALIMGLAILILPKHLSWHWLSLLVIIIGASLIYFISLYLLKGLTKADLRILKRH